MKQQQSVTVSDWVTKSFGLSSVRRRRRRRQPQGGCCCCCCRRTEYKHQKQHWLSFSDRFFLVCDIVDHDRESKFRTEGEIIYGHCQLVSFCFASFLSFFKCSSLLFISTFLYFSFGILERFFKGKNIKNSVFSFTFRFNSLSCFYLYTFF